MRPYWGMCALVGEYRSLGVGLEASRVQAEPSSFFSLLLLPADRDADFSPTSVCMCHAPIRMTMV